MNWQAFDDSARPFAIYVCALAIAICCFLPWSYAIALPLAAAVVGSSAYLRTVDKKTLATAATADKQTEASVAVAQKET